MHDEIPLKKILVLSANPKGTKELRLDEEIREIKQGLRLARERERFWIESSTALRYRDIRREILSFEPQIVHFSGHGAGEKGLVFEDETGQQKLVDAEALAGLFELCADEVECVLLNACYSEVQAKAIAKNIDYVIGMNQEIGDKAAIEFALGFYDALFNGKSFEKAYKYGRNAIQMASIPEHLTPQLLRKNQLGVKPTNKNTAKVPNVEDRRKETVVSPSPLQETKTELESDRPLTTDDLSSEKGLDYTQLRDLLKAGKWKEADRETLAVMLKVADREIEGKLSSGCMKNFPSTDLHTIDRLWLRYSNERFGFSVQKRTWQNFGNNWQQFGENIGWRVNNRWIDYNQLTFNSNACQGHLPAMWEGKLSEWGLIGSWLDSLLSRPDL